MVEINDKWTLDSYRIRSNNVMSLLIELDILCEGWLQKRIKSFDTVINTVKELSSALKHDNCLDLTFYPINALINLFNEYSQKGGKDPKLGKTIQYLIKDIINRNTEKYLDNLTSKIDSFLFKTNSYGEEEFLKNLHEFDTFLLAWSCEIVRKGHSKTYLYFKIRDLANEI